MMVLRWGLGSKNQPINDIPLESSNATKAKAGGLLGVFRSMSLIRPYWEEEEEEEEGDEGKREGKE